MNKIFSELEGFAIYDPIILNEYLEQNNFIGCNLLKLFTETDQGEFVTENGIVIPIFGVPSDYYHFRILDELPANYITCSDGWIIHLNETINVIGIGYLVDLSKIKNEVSFSIEKGWYQLKIVSFIEDNEKGFGFILNKTEEKPHFHGDMMINYW